MTFLFRRPLNRFSRIAVLATVVASLCIAVATLTPLPRVVSVGGGDKLHHVVAFALLVLPVAVLRPRWLPVVMPVLAVYGGLIELIQPSVGRSRELDDWLADLLGIGLGVCCGVPAHYVLRRWWRGGRA